MYKIEESILSSVPPQAEVSWDQLGLATKEFSDVVDREVNMGFSENPFFDESSGYKSNGCQRISYCSCDCNHCSWVIA